MFRKTVILAALVGLVGSVVAQDYAFPSVNPPGGKTPAEVDQFVSFIWDDNGYSGEIGTSYEPKSGTVAWNEVGYVGGMQPSWDGNGGLKTGGLNPLSINEGDMGISWAVKTLGPKLGGGHMTFNMISGLFIPTWGPKWYNRQSEYGSYDNGTTTGDLGESVPWVVAVAWGREQLISTTQGGAPSTQISYMVEGVKKMVAAGHELGNHTIDHIETNSPLPLSMWPNGGELFDNGGASQTDALGNPFNEAGTYGTSGFALTAGWKEYSGKALSQAGWVDLIALGEQDGPKQGISGTLKGFRAPRLEVNSAMFYALAQKGYLYDCGLEEGYEEHRDGTNFVWPYTTDNGAINTWTQQEWGETIQIDSMPTGLWQVPVNVMIVPENIRPAVWSNSKTIAIAEGHTPTTQDSIDWVGTGKITGFDFNMFILWGMTGANVTATLNNTLDKRLAGNKAPMQIGCHTDYFTPIYDYQTLLADFNKDKYGLVVSNGWNTWIDRKNSWEAFATSAVGKGAKFVSGVELITAIKGYQTSETVAASNDVTSQVAWNFSGDALGTTSPSSTVIGALTNVSVNMAAASGGDYPYGAFAADVTPVGMTHIEVTYKTTAPLKLSIVLTDDTERVVILNHTNASTDRNSGKIPLSAFEQDQYAGIVGLQATAGENDIKGIMVAPLTVGDVAETVTFTVKDIKIYATSVTPVNGIAINPAKLANGVSIAGMQSNGLKLNVGTAGKYNVSIFTANGRMIKTFNNAELQSGINNLPTSKLASGVYMIRVNGINTQLGKSFSAIVR